MINIAMIAWPKSDYRLKYLEQSLRSTREKVTENFLPVPIIVSMETDEVLREQQLAAEAVCQQFDALPRWRSKPASLGGNMNDALRHAVENGASHILLTQDDWEWLEPTELSYDAAHLDHNLGYALIRYATFYCRLDRQLTDKLWDVDMSSDWAYGDQPHLRRATFADEFGWYAVSQTEDYGTPETDLWGRLVREKWRIAAYSPNRVEHCGVLSTSILRQQAMGRSAG